MMQAHFVAPIIIACADPVVVTAALVITIPAAVCIVYVLTAKRELTHVVEKIARDVRGEH